MRRVRGRLWEVVSYESQTARGLSQEEVLTHLPFEENVLHAIFQSMLFCKMTYQSSTGLLTVGKKLSDMGKFLSVNPTLSGD